MSLTSPSTSKRFRPVAWLRSYATPLFLLLVAACQMVLVQSQGLSSWRGGGFGMYGGFHPRHYEAWLFSGEKTPQRYAKEHSPTTRFAKSVRPCLTFRNADLLESCAAKAGLESDDLVQIWQLEFDPRSLELSRQLVLERGDRP